MVQSPTNGHGKDDERPAARGATSSEARGEDAASSEDDPTLLARGSMLGRYLVLERLGAGAMGVVYAAYDPELDRKVAIKVLRSQDEGGESSRRQARLVREAKAIARVSHPNVVGIFDVGVHEGRVFLAMEYLANGTLREWLSAQKRSRQAILKMFIEVGRGLAGAHAEGLVHRDFKPDNVLIDKGGVPKVVDFGLVQLSAALEDSFEGVSASSSQVLSSLASSREMALTRTGALTGTPAYMAPEQFLGKGADARTDQFAFCLALYEALYGERPFAGNDVINLADSVISQRFRAPSKSSDVPIWLRKCLVRGLKGEPSQRYASLNALIQVLEVDPVARLRKRVIVSAGVLALLAFVVVVQRNAQRHRRDLELQIADHRAQAKTFEDSAGKSVARYVTYSQQAFEAFDQQKADDGERLWDQAKSHGAEAVGSYRAAVDQAGIALSLVGDEGGRRQFRSFVSGALRGLEPLIGESTDAATLAGEIRKSLQGVVGASGIDGSGLPIGRLALSLTGGDTSVQIEKYERSPDGTFQAAVLPEEMTSSGSPRSLPVGSYRLTFRCGGRAVRYPVVIRANEGLELAFDLSRCRVPAGYELVPAGRFFFGDGNEELRQAFLKTTPIHDASTASYLIGTSEVTYKDWISFLEDDGRVDDVSLRPSVDEQRGSSLGGSVKLGRDTNQRWTIALSPSAMTYSATRGQPIRYLRRKQNAMQDWTRMPVTGISENDMQVYLRWLDRSGRLRGARLCSEREWERTARGADDRSYPHGNTLRPEDANYDATYGRVPEAFGPDEVCSHARSTSPFGVCDMAGNVLELTKSDLQTGEFVIRGGGYYFFQASERSTNREPFLPNGRSAHVGFRVCADADELIGASWRAKPLSETR